jgi:ABC-type amino acid transport substrate-binding protein
VIWPHNPGWTAEAAEFLWSKPILREENWLIIKKGLGATIRSQQDVHGLTLGTIHGYHYPTLAELFATKLAIRDDVAKFDQNY